MELDQNMKRSMRAETEMHFADLMYEDRSVMEFIESDYTYVNSSLALVYGLTNLNIKGAEISKIFLPPDNLRGGILTQGTELTVT